MDNQKFLQATEIMREIERYRQVLQCFKDGVIRVDLCIEEFSGVRFQTALPEHLRQKFNAEAEIFFRGMLHEKEKEFSNL